MMTKSIETKPPVLTRVHLWVMTIATGMVVANLYYNQPLLADIAEYYKVSAGEVGMISMLTQIGYATGMLFIIPLGDMVKRKKLIIIDFALIIISLLLAAFSPTVHFLMFASFLIGCSSVIPQLLVPMAAHLAPADQRGKTVGFIMSGLLI